MHNAILLLDIIIAAINVAARANQVLRQAALDDRDVTDSEIEQFKTQTDALREQWN